MGASLRLVSSLTIWGPPLISFLAAYYMGHPQISFLHTLWVPLQIIFFCLLYGGPTQISFLHTIWRPLQINFIAYYTVAPQISFRRRKIMQLSNFYFLVNIVFLYQNGLVELVLCVFMLAMDNSSRTP